MLLPSAYLPPVSYLAEFAGNDAAEIDGREHFVKQTIRNRCHILSPNGIQPLIIPVVHDDRTRKPMEEIRISYDHPWQRQHWRSIEAAYRRSAFFEFYQDDFEPFYRERFEFLMDFNSGLLKLVLQWLGMKNELKTTEIFVPYHAHDRQDKRTFYNSGTPENAPNHQAYPQVFSSKYGFVNGLSIIDLIFCVGPASGEYLKKEYLLNRN
jgi:hypothetical protein